MVNNNYLPIGDADIKNVISSGFYVDKTRYAYELLQGAAQFVFLARPRDLASPCS